MRNTILVAGGTGGVGKALQESFNEHGLQGIFVGREGGRYDLTDTTKTQQLFIDTNPGIVIFLSANVGGLFYNKLNPANLIRDNLLMGINMLDACVKFKIDNLYITSTCCGYPKYCPVPQKETDFWGMFNGEVEESTNRSYAVAKKTIIRMAQAYREQFGLKSTSLILANLFGPFDTFDPNRSHVVPSLIKKFVDAKQNNKPTVECFGTGTATRDLISSQDVTNLLVKMVVEQFDYPEPINIGSGKDISIYDLAHMIKELTEYEGEIVFTGKIGDGQPRQLLDNTLLKFLVPDWEPTIDLKTGLIKTIDWYRQNQSFVK